jgi:transcriptional regulator with XRE-family HTH domain
MEKFDVNRRVMQLIEYLSISNNQFARELGVSSSRISALATNRNRPDSDLLALILNVYGFVSGQWLVTGKGNMLNEDCQSTAKVKEDVRYENNVPPVDCEKCKLKDQLITSLKEHNETLKEQNQFLKGKPPP